MTLYPVHWTVEPLGSPAQSEHELKESVSDDEVGWDPAALTAPDKPTDYYRW